MKLSLLSALSLLAAPTASEKSGLRKVEKKPNAARRLQDTITITFDPVTPNAPTQDYVDGLIQNHLISNNGFVQFESATFTGHKCFGLFANGLSASASWPDEGIILSSGLAENIVGPNDSDGKTEAWYLVPGDADLDALVPGYDTYDACVIEFQFACPPETAVFTPEVNFNYVFGSEEYLEYVDSPYNDVFGFFLNGEDIALVPGTDDPVTIDNVNPGDNPAFFVDNTGPIRENNQADGYTTLLTATGSPVADTNTIKLAIADAGDRAWDSWVLLQAGTFSCTPLTPEPKCETEEDLGQTCVHDNANPDAYQHFNCCKHDSSLQDHGVRCTTCGACQGNGSLLDGKNGIGQTCCTANGPPSKKVDSSGTIIGDCVDGEYDHCCKLKKGGGHKDFVCFDEQESVDSENFCAGLAA